MCPVFYHLYPRVCLQYYLCSLFTPSSSLALEVVFAVVVTCFPLDWPTHWPGIIKQISIDLPLDIKSIFIWSVVSLFRDREILPRVLCILRSGGLRTQILKSHLVRTQSLNVLPLKPGVGEYIAIHATVTARNFFLVSTLPVHSPAFFLKPLPIFSCVGYG